MYAGTAHPALPACMWVLGVRIDRFTSCGHRCAAWQLILEEESAESESPCYLFLTPGSLKFIRAPLAYIGAPHCIRLIYTPKRFAQLQQEEGIRQRSTSRHQSTHTKHARPLCLACTPRKSSVHPYTTQRERSIC